VIKVNAQFWAAVQLGRAAGLGLPSGVPVHSRCSGYLLLSANRRDELLSANKRDEQFGANAGNTPALSESLRATSLVLLLREPGEEVRCYQ
jgi:hypothetical protein